MRIDCETCPVRDQACGSCVVTLLLGPPGQLRGHIDEESGATLAADERRALQVLAEVGLIERFDLLASVLSRIRHDAGAAAVGMRQVAS